MEWLDHEAYLVDKFFREGKLKNIHGNDLDRYIEVKINEYYEADDLN